MRKLAGRTPDGRVLGRPRIQRHRTQIPILDARQVQEIDDCLRQCDSAAAWGCDATDCSAGCATDHGTGAWMPCTSAPTGGEVTQSGCFLQGSGLYGETVPCECRWRWRRPSPPRPLPAHERPNQPFTTLVAIAHALDVPRIAVCIKLGPPRRGGSTRRSGFRHIGWRNAPWRRAAWRVPATQVSGSLACSGPHLLESRGR